jgi:hypothetical protein
MQENDVSPLQPASMIFITIVLNFVPLLPDANCGVWINILKFSGRAERLILLSVNPQMFTHPSIMLD